MFKHSKKIRSPIRFHVKLNKYLYYIPVQSGIYLISPVAHPFATSLTFDSIPLPRWFLLRLRECK